MTKQEIEKEVWSFIKLWKDNNDFIKPTQLFKFARWVVIITTKGKGKSWDALQYIAHALPNIEFCWIRNTEKELNSSGLVDSFTHALSEANLDMEEYRITSKGLYKVPPGKKQYERGILKGIFSTMNKSMNEASQNALACDLVVYDEFINPEFQKNGLFTAFLKHCKTMIRKNKNAHVLMLGNAHTADNDILNGFGCELDWESEEDQIYYNEHQSLLVVKLGDYKVSAMEDADNMVDRAGCYSEEYQRFCSGKAGVNDMWGVRSWEIHNIEKYFTPLFTYDCAEGAYTVGKVSDEADEKVRGKTYVKQIYSNVWDVPRVCYRPTDKRVYNTYVYDVKDYTTVRYLLNEYNSGNLLFSTAFGKTEFLTFILPMLQTLLRDEDAKLAR